MPLFTSSGLGLVSSGLGLDLGLKFLVLFTSLADRGLEAAQQHAARHLLSLTKQWLISY